MVRSIIGLGDNLSLTVIAEGIEDTDQLDELRDAGCNIGQGYLFARPVPPEAATQLLLEHCLGPAPASSVGASRYFTAM